MSATTAFAAPEASASLGRLWTVADLAALPRGPHRHELDDGRLVVMSQPADIHSAASTKISGAFLYLGELLGYGKSRNPVGLILRRSPDRVVGPDACFIATASLPIRVSPEGFLETIPDIVAEVRSKNDSMPEVERKVADYLAAGVKLVWVVDPLRSLAIVYRAGIPAVTLGPIDALTCDDIIPGFRLLVADVLRQ